jgi:preprotein translocase subunit SecE
MARSPGVPRRVGSEAARRAFSLSIVGDVFSELRRVTWPSRQETMRLTLMVIAVAAVIGAFLGLVDLGFTRIFETLILGG